MAQKKKEIKKEIKVKRSKNQPLLKNSINIKIDLEDDKNKDKKKSKRKRKINKTNDNNVSFVDELGKPISNEIINKSFNSTFIPQPFSRNSSIIGTTINDSSIMERVIDKMSRLNSSLNQSSNINTSNMSINQSRPAPPQLPRQALSTIAPASPSVAPQSLNFDLSSPVRPVGMTPLQASTMALNRVQQYALQSQRAATISQDAMIKIFKDTTDVEREEIIRATKEVASKHNSELLGTANGGARANKLKSYFVAEFKGQTFPRDAAGKAWEYYSLLY